MTQRDASPRPIAIFARALPVLLAALATELTASAQFATSVDLGQFGIDDVEITPDDRFAVARANELPTTVLVYDIVNGGSPIRHQSFTFPGFARTGPAQDAVLVTNERAFILGSPTYVLDLSAPGAPVLAALDLGEFPRDLALTPNGPLVVVRGGDSNAHPSGGGIHVLDVATGALLASAPGEPGNDFHQRLDGVGQRPAAVGLRALPLR